MLNKTDYDIDLLKNAGFVMLTSILGLIYQDLLNCTSCEKGAAFDPKQGVIILNL